MKHVYKHTLAEGLLPLGLACATFEGWGSAELMTTVA